jgi:hypothetical protein
MLPIIITNAEILALTDLLETLHEPHLDKRETETVGHTLGRISDTVTRAGTRHGYTLELYLDNEGWTDLIRWIDDTATELETEDTPDALDDLAVLMSLRLKLVAGRMATV